MLNFNFLRKGLGIVSQQILCMIFQKMLLMLYSINWPNVIIWLSLLLEILSNMWIAIDCWPGCDIIDFEISPIFITKPFLYITKKSRQKFKYLEKEKSFKGEIKSIFYHFWKASSCQKLFQTCKYPFKMQFPEELKCLKFWLVWNLLLS